MNYSVHHPIESKPHKWDDDGCCIYCGLDGAEWRWWRYSTYEGRAMQTPQPLCLQDEADRVDDEQADDEAVQQGRW